MKVDIFQCDGCGKQKGDVNHWWIMRFQTSTDGTGIRQLVLVPWGENTATHGCDSHLCGAECVQKKVSEFLSKPVTTGQ